jgi:hypothetical protein
MLSPPNPIAAQRSSPAGRQLVYQTLPPRTTENFRRARNRQRRLHIFQWQRRRREHARRRGASGRAAAGKSMRFRGGSTSASAGRQGGATSRSSPTRLTPTTSGACTATCRGCRHGTSPTSTSTGRRRTSGCTGGSSTSALTPASDPSSTRDISRCKKKIVTFLIKYSLCILILLTLVIFYITIDDLSYFKKS